MQTSSIAKIISYNLYGETICASAARISTTKGTSYEIFEKSRENEKNRGLIEKVLASGHQSILEHAVFSIALWNVSAFVEQFFIEFRLGAFTVKSRRYVDFSGLGYHIPEELAPAAREKYCQYMELLFKAYGEMLDGGVPKEDARFLLPYAFHSNFYCTMNARELVHVIRSIRSGRGRTVPELQSIADQLTEQLKELFPSALNLLDSSEEVQPKDELQAAVTGDPEGFLTFVSEREAGGVQMVQAPAAPEKLLEAAYRVSHPGTGALDLEAVLASDRPRELEQLSYSFLISDITLSGITHIVRHRMQSIIIPPIGQVSPHKLILPATVERDPRMLDLYRATAEQAWELRQKMCGDPALRKYSYYFALSGNVTDIFTTMNGRELLLFTRLRSCNRAQWEIRDVSIRMLRELRGNCPRVFDHFGPTCFVRGFCPEGKLSCGKMDQVITRFSHPLTEK